MDENSWPNVEFGGLVRPVAEADVTRFLDLIAGQRAKGVSLVKTMITGYTAVLASPGFVFVSEKAGPLGNYALRSCFREDR